MNGTQFNPIEQRKERDEEDLRVQLDRLLKHSPLSNADAAAIIESVLRSHRFQARVLPGI